MLSIDEAIAHAREVASRKFDDRVHCISCAEEHEQLAEWLEELKAYRAIGTVEECKNSVLDIQKAYNKAIDDCKELTFREVVYCDSLNDRTEFRELAEQLKESDCTDKLDTHENNEDIIYEMNCPKCHYDMFEIYDRVCNGGKSKYCKITNIHSGSCGDFYGTDWDVECICPKCKTKFTFSDGDY